MDVAGQSPAERVGMIKRIGRTVSTGYPRGEPAGRKAISSMLPAIFEIVGYMRSLSRTIQLSERPDRSVAP
jgi:hypothetical protein